MEPIPEATQAERLTSTLRRAGVLGEGHVNNVTVESSRDTILSRIVRVSLTASGFFCVCVMLRGRHNKGIV